MSALAYSERLDGPADKPKGKSGQAITENLTRIAEFDGNLADEYGKQAGEEKLKRLGTDVVREYEADEASRKEWTDSVERALKQARQKPEKKSYPFEGASNMKYPVLTAAALQFNARCYGAITRGDQPLNCKPHGADKDGMKAKRAQRVSTFSNYQLMKQVDEWDPGTDKLTFMLPVMGSGFRKCYWRNDMKRPAMEFTSSKDVVVPNDAPSFDRAPRMTQPVSYYPYEIDRLIQAGQWRNHKRDEYGRDEDSQKPCVYLEQVRYIDMDDDGVMEPYIVTVSKEHEEVVRIDPAFYANSLYVNETGGVDTILRESPWIDYCFLPDIEGSVYAMGFGQLLESLGSGINTALNQMYDAAHRQNAGGGFVSQGLRLRGGEVRIRPAEFLMVNTPGRVSDAIHELKFEGPSPVLFQLVEFLLGAAQDITSVKDVLTGEAPSGQAMGATLALIEQGTQVLTTIHKRIYRSMDREFRLLMRLNKQYLDPKVYAAYFDDPDLFADLMGMGQQQPQPGMGMGQAPPMGAPPGMGAPPPPQGMPGMGGSQPGMAGPQMAMQPAITAEMLSPEALDKLIADFELSGMDIAPSADPRSITDMQRMMRAEYLGRFLGQPGMNNAEIQRRQLEAANIEDVDKLFLSGPSPMDMLAAETAKVDLELKKAQVKTEEQKTVKTAKEAENIRQESNDKAFDRGLKTGMAGGMGGMEGSPDDAGVFPDAEGGDGSDPGAMPGFDMGVGGGPPA